MLFSVDFYVLLSVGQFLLWYLFVDETLTYKDIELNA